MSIEKAKAYLRQFGAEDRVIEFPVSSATVELAAEAAQGRDTHPFATPTYWAALQDSGSAIAQTGWQLQLVTVWSAAATHPSSGDTLLAACPLYVKAHSYGEYVFDWAWADAYQRRGLARLKLHSRILVGDIEAVRFSGHYVLHR